MNKLLVALIAGLFAVSVNAFAADTHKADAKHAAKAAASAKGDQKGEHQITVGNEKAATSGSTSEDKTVKGDKTQKPHGKGHEKGGKGHNKD
jgi:hypothetical protein